MVAEIAGRRLQSGLKFCTVWLVTPFVMAWSDEPATERQIAFLKQFGHEPSHALTKAEASELLQKILHRPAHEDESQLSKEAAGNHAYQLRKEVETAKASALSDNAAQAKGALEAATVLREEFWMDTCRDPAHMKSPSVPAMTLYRLHGCRFETPTREHVEEILGALDKALPTWEQEHPELFYQTLELNFRDLLRV